MMHTIDIHPNKVVCSCKYIMHVITGAEAQQLAYSHAHNNMPALVTDLRQCSKKCREAAADRDHHIHPRQHDADCPQKP